MTSESFFDDRRLLGPRATVRTPRPDGFLLTHPDALQSYPRCTGEWIEQWAGATPDASAFAEPDGRGGWRSYSWAALRAVIGRVAQALLDLDLAPGKPVVILSDNALDHLVLTFAALHVGRPVSAISSAYCRLAGTDFSRVHGILAMLDPALVYASDAAVYGPALAGSRTDAVRVFSVGAETVPGAIAFDALAAAVEAPAVMEAFRRITPDTHAKYLLTSGSTGHPKVVINTQRMLCANQQMLGQTLRFLDHEKPVLLDWLPWSHTFGGNHNVNLVLRNGGTFHIDDGRPVPGAIERTIPHLRDVRPTVYFNVPRGFEMLLPALETDDAFARHFFGDLRMLFYSGAGMPASTWQRLEVVAARVRSEPLWLTTSWGATETGPAITFANWHLDGPGVIGLPMPGVTLKFLVNGDKLEMRVRGDHVFPGYRNDAEATQKAFDDEGYYCIGDAGHLRDEDDPLQGIVFNGRVAEDFKLSSGTWVSVGTLRLQVVSALAPHVQDVVVTGHERDEIGLLIFVNAASRTLDPKILVAHVRSALRTLRATAGGSSRAPARAMLMADGPHASMGEITDKGYLNQRTTLARRAADVAALHAEPCDPRVILP